MFKSTREKVLERITAEEHALNLLPKEAAGLKAVRPELKAFRELLAMARAKPRLAVMGIFNSGKSSFLNAFLGPHVRFPSGEILPVDYVPCTKALCLARQATTAYPDGTVRIEMDNGDDLVGDHRLLQRGAHHEGDIAHFKFIEVYIDSPLLTDVDLFDTPGYESGNGDDDQISEAVSKSADVIVYLSSSLTFLQNSDIAHLSETVGLLSGRSPSLADGLRRLFIVATMWDTFERDRVPQGDNSADHALRLFRNRAQAYGKSQPEEVEDEALVSRMYVTSRKHAQHADDPLRLAITQVVSEELPRQLLQRIDEASHRLRRQIASSIRLEILALGRRLNDAQETTRRVADAKAGLAAFTADRAAYRTEMSALTATIKEKDLPALIDKLRSEISERALKNLIKGRWKKKEEAKEALPAYVQALANKRVNTFVERKSKQIAAVVDKMLTKIQGQFGELELIDGAYDDSVIDVKGLFLGGLAGAGTLGALGAWAATVGNLGGYIITAQLVGLLSSIGISVGGTAQAIAFISAWGGPVLWGIGGAVLLAALVWSLFGDSWEAILARKFSDQFDKKTIPSIERSVSAYFEKTNKAFTKAIDALTKSLESEVAKLESEHAANEPVKVEERRDRLAGILRDFEASRELALLRIEVG